VNVIEEKLTKCIAAHQLVTVGDRQTGRCSCGKELPAGPNEGLDSQAFHVTQEVLARFMVMPTRLADDLI
jgi:hypothetical protein